MKLFGDANWWMPNWTRIALHMPKPEPVPPIVPILPIVHETP